MFIEMQTSSLKEREECFVKTLPNYPPHPPMPESRHPEQAGDIPADCQLPEHSGTVGD